MMNMLGVGTFHRRATQNAGSGFYLLISSYFGLMTSLSLSVKLIFLFINNQGNVSCALIEFIIKWSLTSCECLNACVAIERTLAVNLRTKFSRIKSKRVAKRISIVVPMVVGVICSPELIYRRMVVDTTDETNWCVFTLNADQPKLLNFYSALNICLFLIPLTINLICSVGIIVGTGLLKQKTITSAEDTRRSTNINLNFTRINRNFLNQMKGKTIKAQIIKHKHILVAPILLAIFAVPRLVFAFIFVCSKLDRFPFLTLPSYLIGFLPSMSLLFAFILPSDVYRSAALAFIKSIIPAYFQNYFFLFRQR
ncbi:unnamed protein product [Adineta ricciae]|nr:unnamed protein product [Adineta ricciae]